jgi:PHD/YefM family antitoxin component YafN of YafNO toxin-antitoxin module
MLIPTPQNVKNISDFRKDPDAVLGGVKDGPLYLFRGSEPKAVVLDIDEFARIQDEIEDYRDSLIAMKYEKNPEDGGISFEDLLKKYKIKLKRE